MANTPKLSEVELATETPVMDVLSVPEESVETGGFFQRLMRKRTLETVASQELPEVEPTETAAAQADNSPAIADADASPVVVLAQKTKRRFWPFLRKPAPDQDVTVDVAIETQEVSEEIVQTDGESAAPSVGIATSDPEPAGELVEPEKRNRLFGFLRAKPVPQAEQEVELASLGPVPNTPVAVQPAPEQIETATPTPRRGLFGRLLKSGENAKLTGPDAREVPLGAALPYGEVGRVCGAKKAQLGSEVAKYPERKPQYRLYDSDRGNIASHVFYVTGFPDGCARIFSAALALFGSPVMHERLRYGLPDEIQPYSATDRAYEQVKSRICKVSRKKPCGEKIGLLEENTVFLSTYENFQDNARWSNMLLHQGQVMAVALVDG
ncbi:MAG: hypothetical protein Q9M48_14165 [Rhodobacterales bacterium]|nr:hypothetical protein [Rhodobacterales bacterium]